MICIDRMELEDVGGNPIKLAQAILDQLPEDSAPIPVREIAKALDIYELEERAGIGFEGALIAPEDKSEGAIIVRADRPEERKRFTIGHELGHYLNPWHRSPRPDGFRCTSKDLTTEKNDQNSRLVQMELEANEFSAELLMPSNRIRRYLRSRTGADLQHIMELAEQCFVSKEAMARRYIEHNANDPAAVVFSKDNKIRYIRRHGDFPWLNVRNGSLLPQETISARSKAPVGHIGEWEEAAVDVWVDSKPGQSIFEQTVAQSNGFRLTLLTHEHNTYSDDEDELEDDIENRWNPTFARGR